jgi:chromosome segregation ATPase
MVTVLEHQRNAAANQAAHFQAKANMLDEDNRTLRQGIEDLKKQVEAQKSQITVAGITETETNRLVKSTVEQLTAVRKDCDTLRKELEEVKQQKDLLSKQLSEAHSPQPTPKKKPAAKKPAAKSNKWGFNV